jgi:acetoin:2,6-dichlorophenolindophenol oxidoreductase subunit beta
VSQTTYRAAIKRALGDAMEADERILLLGEDIAAAGGAFKVTDGLLERFGDQRVLDTPISEQAIIGAAIGTALRGLRPMAEIMFADFAACCFDGIANELAKYRYMTGGQVEMPVVIRLANGAGAGFAAQHSQTCENWFLNVPGLKIVAPATPADAYGLLRSAFDDPDPVLYFEHKHLYTRKGDLNDSPVAVPIGSAAVVAAGEHITVVANQLMRHRAEEALTMLADVAISAELIDPRSLAPLDTETIGASLAKTNRLLVVQESAADGSWGASLISRLVGRHFELFDAPPRLLASEDTPAPYAANLEAAWMPSVQDIVAAATEVCAY